MINGSQVSIHLRFLNIRNRGTSVTTSGSIIVASSRPNQKLRPGQLIRANEYATSADETTVPTTANSTMIRVLTMNLVSGNS